MWKGVREGDRARFWRGFTFLSLMRDGISGDWIIRGDLGSWVAKKLLELGVKGSFMAFFLSLSL